MVCFKVILLWNIKLTQDVELDRRDDESEECYDISLQWNSLQSHMNNNLQGVYLSEKMSCDWIEHEHGKYE